MSLNDEKIQDLNKISDLIFESNNNEKNQNSNKMLEHANFYHNFAEKNISSFDLVTSFFSKEHDDTQNNFIPIITYIKERNKDTIEISRIHLYKDYYNDKPYNTEKIIINRKAIGNENLFISLYENKFKKIITTFTSDSLFTKVAKFKAFRNPNEVLFFQNIFHYQCILEINKYYTHLTKTPDKKELNFKNLAYHEFMKNLF